MLPPPGSPACHGSRVGPSPGDGESDEERNGGFFSSSMIWVHGTHHAYVYTTRIQQYIDPYVCLNEHNDIYGLYEELRWRFSKDENCSGVSQITGNYSGIYLINPIKRGFGTPRANFAYFRNLSNGDFSIMITTT